MRTPVLIKDEIAFARTVLQYSSCTENLNIHRAQRVREVRTLRKSFFAGHELLISVAVTQ
jgi:hypothetical protein